MTTRSAILVLLLLVVPVSARAQVNHSASVGGTIAATSMDSSTSLSFAGSFTYRFNSVVGLEIEATMVPELESDFPGAVIQIFPGPTFNNAEGRAAIFANSVRVAIPTTTSRLEPYFVAGGGVASVRHSADLRYSPLPYSVLPTTTVPVTGTISASDLSRLTIPSILPVPITQRVTSSTVDLALTLGGGLDVRVASQLSIEADLRLFRLMGETDRNVGRFGVGVRYRF
jgi:opacity protein-like surface antigen